MPLVALIISERESDAVLVTMEALVVGEVGEEESAPRLPSTSAFSLPDFWGPPAKISLKLRVEAISCRFSWKLSWSKEFDLRLG